MEGRHAVAVAPAERAEGGFVGWVDGHVDALAVGFHDEIRLGWLSLVLEMASFYSSGLRGGVR